MSLRVDELAKQGDQKGLRIVERRRKVREQVKDRLPKNTASYEARLDNLQRRIKKIEDNPDPTKPAANKVRYQLEAKRLSEMLEAWKTGGKPFGGYGPLMGFQGGGVGSQADRTSAEDAKRYFDIMERHGFNYNSCDRTILTLPMYLCGDFPAPDVVQTSNFECYPIFLSAQAVAGILGVPLLSLDRPPIFDEGGLAYMTRQIEEEIDYLETVFPGHKFNMDMLIEQQEGAKVFWDIQHDIYHKLRKRKPCPISGREAFREVGPPGWEDQEFWLQYWRDYRDQLFENAETGKVPSKLWGVDEKLRLMLAVTGPFFYDPFTFLDRLGVGMPIWTWSDQSEKLAGREPTTGDLFNGRKLKPLEENARGRKFGWGDRSHYYVNSIITTAKDLELDGIIYFKQIGCSPTMPLGGIVSERAERELGIPTLEIEARQQDQRGFNAREMLSKMADFVNVCLARKHLPPLTQKELEKAGYNNPDQFYTYTKMV